MARALMLALLSLCAACFHATPYSATASHDALRSTRSGKTNTSGTGKGPRQPEPGAVLSAEQTVELALANNPDVAVLVAQAEVAEAEVGAARQLDNPQLRLTGFNVDDVIANKSTMNVGLRVPIPRPGALRAQVQGAKQIAAGQAARTEDAQRMLRARVYKLYARLAMLAKDIEQTSHATAVRAERREQIAARAAMSVATRVDVAVADVLYAESRQAEADARDRLAVVEEELRRIVGVEHEVFFAVDAGELRVVDADLDREALTERAMEQRPSLRTAHANVQAARAEQYVARSRAYPWLDWAQLQYRVQRDAQPAAFGFGVALTLPIFSVNRGEIRSTRARVRQREREVKANLALVAGEVDEAVARVQRTARRVHALERELLPQVEAAVREAEAALASGAIDPIGVADLDTRAIEARRIHLAALLDHREAVIDLEAAVGEPLPATRHRDAP